ncbi:MAG: amidohydrolase family protein [Desulfomonilaceae bacterium]|nr:amidohydrolase family protein [Desulfomonilaceae bacterium]
MEISRITANTVFSDGVRPATIHIENGVVSAVSEPIETFSDAELVFPGFIDIHVHAREFPRPENADPKAREKWETACRKETFASAGRAAVHGGVVLFAAMPNDAVPPDNAASYALKASLTEASLCPVLLFAAVTERSEPWANLPYKVYLDSARSPVSFTSWSDLETVLARYRGCHVFFHAEDPEILGQSPYLGPRWETRPPEAEVRAVDRLLDLTNRFDLQAHICHVSTERGATLIDDYNRNARVPVTCEVTPHHLYFSVERGGVLCAGRAGHPAADLLDCNPPLRSEHDRRFLVDALRQGLVQVLATDHAPHTREDKAEGAPGMPHLDTAGPFVCWLMRDCGFSPTRIAQVFSEVPGRIMAPYLEGRQGRIEPGNTACLTVLDPSGSTLVEGSRIMGKGPLETRCKWSPFEGIPLPGTVKQTVVGGREVFAAATEIE